MAEPTETGGETKVLDKNNSNDTNKRRDPVLTEREQLLARMDQQIEDRRKQEEADFLASAGENPEAWLLHKRMQLESQGGQPLESEEPPPTDEEPTDLEDGTQSVEPVHAAPKPAPKPAVAPAQRVSQKGEDPLGDYIVRVGGKPMMKTLVYGKEKLVPLDVARAELQKIGAGNQRLEQAAARHKELDARAAQLQRTEAELAARSRTAVAAPPPIDDKAFDTEAEELVRSLVEDTPEKAAARLAQTLKKIRQAPPPQIDVDAITDKAVKAATQSVEARDANKALRDGFDTFTRDYHDIASDPELFAMADRKTEVIAAEHPEWNPAQVMMEAGKQTRAWLQSIGAPVKGPTKEPATVTRQQRKEGLRPMPTPRTARPVVQQETDGRQSAAEVVAEMRKSRGQPF